MAARYPQKRQVEGARNALGEFLRARRRLVAPEEVGIRVTDRRRGPGLRREEVATLAGVSSPYYIRLEQGRDRHPSAEVVAALGRALRLDEQTLAYFKRLAGQAPIDSQPPGGVDSLRASVAQLVHSLDLPAVVIGRYRDMLAANRLAQMLHVGYTPGQNLLRFLFFDLRARERVIDWEEVTRQAVSTLRADSIANVDDERLRELTDELSRRSVQFRDLWARHDVITFTTGRIGFNNPLVGPITLNYESFPVAGAPGQTFGILFPTPAGADERALKKLKKRADEPEP
jgi:transcriptional regulator with XRE-family HTH domain